MIHKFLFLLVMGLGGSAFASSYHDVGSCPTQSLAFYTDSYASNTSFCQIGSLYYSGFYFDDITNLGSISASDLIVTPNFATNSFSLLPINTKPELFNQNFLNFERYYFAWYVDPPPIIGGDELSLDPPDANVEGYKWGCTDNYFSDTNADAVTTLANLGSATPVQGTFSCLGRIDNPPPDYFLETIAPTPVDASVTFPSPVATIDVRMVLDIGSGKVNGFYGISGGHPIVDPNAIPEPATNAMIAAGLVALIGFSKKKFKR